MEDSNGGSSYSHDADSHDADAISATSNSQKKLKFGRWRLAVRQCVTATLFRCVQFINRDEDIEHGSSIQTCVCRECNILPLEQIEFWNTNGREEVLEVLRRKRQAVTTALKSRHARKYVDMNFSVWRDRCDCG